MAKQPDAWAQRWEDALRTVALGERPEGAGWKSTPELMAEMKLTKDGVRYRMDSLRNRGRMERAMGRSPSGQRVAYYRPTPNKSPTRTALL